MNANPIVHGVRYCGVTHGQEPRVFASLRLERRHRYSKHSAFGERVKWKRFGYRELGQFGTRAQAKAAVKAALDAKHQEALEVFGRSSTFALVKEKLGI